LRPLIDDGSARTIRQQFLIPGVSDVTGNDPKLRPNFTPLRRQRKFGVAFS